MLMCPYRVSLAHSTHWTSPGLWATEGPPWPLGMSHLCGPRVIPHSSIFQLLLTSGSLFGLQNSRKVAVDFLYPECPALLESRAAVPSSLQASCYISVSPPVVAALIFYEVFQTFASQCNQPSDLCPLLPVIYAVTLCDSVPSQSQGTPEKRQTFLV